MARRLLKISRHSTRPDDVGNFFAPRFMENWFLQVQQCRHIWGGRNGWFGNYFSIKYTLYDWSKLNELFNWLHAIAYRLWLNVISYRKKLFHNTNWTHIPNAIFTLIQMPQLEKKLFNRSLANTFLTKPNYMKNSYYTVTTTFGDIKFKYLLTKWKRYYI